MAALELIAFDIETTGFAVADTVTVAGFALPVGVRVFCQTGGRSPSSDDVEMAVRERVDCHVQVSLHATERALLEALGTFVTERFADDDVLLAAFNGETWQAGFDLSFLRTRLARTGVEWPFQDLPYTDLLPVLTQRFNTTIDGEADARRDLAGVYATLCDGAVEGLDPFDDSQEAVTAFENGHFVDLVVHNVADVQRTRQLGLVAERYCSKSDFQLKSLTPTVDSKG
jgi:hypothetical protein